jgi:hypothetical protein
VRVRVHVCARPTVSASPLRRFSPFLSHPLSACLRGSHVSVRKYNLLSLSLFSGLQAGKQHQQQPCPRWRMVECCEGLAHVLTLPLRRKESPCRLLASNVKASEVKASLYGCNISFLPSMHVVRLAPVHGAFCFLRPLSSF